MPEAYQEWVPRSEILTDSEILTLVRLAANRGFKHFRITGGEPLLRADVPSLIREIVATPGVVTVQVTTNGTRLSKMAVDLKQAGLDRINVSLDALDPELYREITRGDLAPVLEGIQAARAAGIKSIKLNTVLMRGKNESEIMPLLEFAAAHDMPLRFIELMPVSLTEMLSEENFLPVAEVKSNIAQIDELIPLRTQLGHGPAKYFRLKKLGAVVGFIGALTDFHFCEQCNKVRITADGKLRPCLGHHSEYDLKAALRPEPDERMLHHIFSQALSAKPPQHLFRDNYQPGRVMTAIGG